MKRELIEFAFTPEATLLLESGLKEYKIKGRAPLLNYPFSFAEVYTPIPSLDILEAYRKIKTLFQKTDAIFFRHFLISRQFPLPDAQNQEEAISIINTLFSIHNYHPHELQRLIFDRKPQIQNLFTLQEAYPFPLGLASPAKIFDSIAWIDTNIKLQVEKQCNNLPLSGSDVKLFVETALKVYSYLIKANDFFLARNMNFNYSIFIQERIIMLLFNHSALSGEKDVIKIGNLTNHIALELLKCFTDISYQKICLLSAFMGVVWADLDEVQRNYLISTNQTLQDLERQLGIENRKWCVNHIDLFLEDIQKNPGVKKVIAGILDDNGESVYDMALFQKLMQDFSYLEITFIANAFPVSNNISLATFKYLLENPYFMNLKQYFATGRAKLVIERQVFRSFEINALNAETLETIRSADITYIKGANFFETFQMADVLRYHCFTSYGLTSQMLTECEKGSGIFARLPPGRRGYVYQSSSQVTTLKEILTY